MDLRNFFGGGASASTPSKSTPVKSSTKAKAKSPTNAKTKTKTPEKDMFKNESSMRRPNSAKRSPKNETKRKAAPTDYNNNEVIDIALSDNDDIQEVKEILDDDDDEDFEPKITPRRRGAKVARTTADKPSRAAATASITPPKPKAKKATTPKSKTKPKKKGMVFSQVDDNTPLQGKAFVCTGIPEVWTSRPEIEDAIKSNGGLWRTGVSGKTDYLVSGSMLETGLPAHEGSKYKKAMSIDVPIISEADLLKMITEGKVRVANKHKNSGVGASSSGSSSNSMIPNLPPAAASSSFTKVGNLSNSYALGKGKAKAGGMGKTGRDESQLWSDRYRPSHATDVVGNKTSLDSLRAWLGRYEAVHVKKTMKPPAFHKSNPGAKAVLISGPPGIGKSSGVAAVARDMGYDVYELNASDARSKKLLREKLSSVVGSGAIVGGAGVHGNMIHGTRDIKRLIIMDEVDGMSSDDRGGVVELIQVIKSSKTPIVCICNDRQKQSVRSLANHCFDVRFHRPQVNMIVQRMMQVVAQEGMTAEQSAIEQIVGSTGNDIRQVLNVLQMWKTTSNHISFSQLKEMNGSGNKDGVQRLSPFDALSFLFNECRRPGKFGLAMDAFFVDIDLLPLMVSEKYIDVVQSGARATANNMVRTNSVGGSAMNDSAVATMDRLARASAAVSDADHVSKVVRGRQQWSLLPLHAALCVRVATIANGRLGGFPGFPEWLGKNSTRNKRMRMLSELTMHLRRSTSCSRTGLRMDYLCALRNEALRKLLSGDPSAPAQLLDFMDEYGMSRDDVFETLREVQFIKGTKNKNLFDGIQSKVKSAFTREYNKRTHRSQALVWDEAPVQKGKGKAKAKAAAKKPKSKRMIVDEDEGEGSQDSEEEEEDDDDDAFVKEAKRTAEMASYEGTKTAPKKRAAGSSSVGLKKARR